MASVAVADRTVPDLNLVVPRGATSFGIGSQGLTITPDLGFNTASDIYAGTIVSGGAGVRVVYSFPDHFRNDDGNVKIIAWIDDPNVKILICPHQVRNYSNGWDTINTGTDGGLITLVQNKKYVYEYTALDANTLRITTWDESGGEPLQIVDMPCATGAFTSPVEVNLGWPPASIMEGYLVDIPLLPPGTDKYTANAQYPYMVRIHQVTTGNVGPTGATFVQQTALSQAADLPAGTYVGYFEPIHALGITSHVDMSDLQDQYVSRRNKLYTAVKSSLLTVQAGTSPNIDVTDIFKVAIPPAPMTGTLTVTA